MNEHADRETIRARVFYAFVFGAMEDTLVVLTSTLHARLGITKSLAAALETLSFLAFPLFVVAAPLGALLATRGARILVRHVRVGLSGGRSDLESPGAVLYSIVIAACVGVAWRGGLRISDFQSVRVATLASTLVALGLLCGGALAVTEIVAPARKLLQRLTRGSRPPQWLPLEDLAVATVGIVALYCLLPAPQAITPAAALVGFAAGPALTTLVPVMGKKARTPLLWVAPVALSLTLGAGFALGRLPNTVQAGLLTRAPYAPIVVSIVRRALDRDHDGYSPVLGGGDCNDADPSIHPDAVDTPGDGIDQNCSGSDAHRFVPPVSPFARDLTVPPQRDNIVLIHIDALRPDHVGFAGYHRPTTPHLDRWREGATWFKNAYTPAPSTRFALSMLFTGLDVDRIPQKRGDFDFTLLPEAVTLAERLDAHHYDRVGLTLSYVIQYVHDLGQGFRQWHTPWPTQDGRSTYGTSAQLTTDAALRYLGTVPADGTRPYFLFLHYECTHDPYIKHPEWDYGNGDVDRYDSALSYCDAEIGRVFDALEARGDANKTATFVYSDHGELLDEHGYTRQHGNTLFEPEVRALLVAKVPGATVREIDAPMYITDMTPTIYELTGLPPDPDCQGWDLMPYLKGASLPARPLFLYADLWRNGVHLKSRGVLDIDGRTKFIFDVSTGTKQLYDLKLDPYELSNIADAEPALTNELAEKVDGWAAYAAAR